MSCLRDSIRQIEPCMQGLVEAMEKASTLTELILCTWHLIRVLGVRLVEEVLTERSHLPTRWSDCPKCGKRLHSKGFVSRQINSVIGVIHWKRRVGRCPCGCKIGQIAPLDDALGLLPHQQTSIELQRLGCLLAIETVAALLMQVSCVSVWHWVKKLVNRPWIGSKVSWRI